MPDFTQDPYYQIRAVIARQAIIERFGMSVPDLARTAGCPVAVAEAVLTRLVEEGELEQVVIEPTPEHADYRLARSLLQVHRLVAATR